jgi:nucleoside-diphosphate-sugar epimerase
LTAKGAAGMIGSVFVDALALTGAHVIALGRSEDAARARFGARLGSPLLTFLRQDVSNPLPGDLRTDYIVHAAGNAHPLVYATDPVGTMNGAYLGALLHVSLLSARGRGVGRDYRRLDLGGKTA